MDEQEVERQLTLWRAEMRMERERRLAASARSPRQSPKRSVPESPRREQPGNAQQSRVALYRSELGETTGRVPSVKLSRYSRPHVDPRDVDFFEARSVLRDYIRNPAPSQRDDTAHPGGQSAHSHDDQRAPPNTSETRVRSRATDVRKRHASPARGVSHRPTSRPKTKILLNKSAVLRMQTAQQSIQDYDKSHPEQAEKDPRLRGETVQEVVQQRERGGLHAQGLRDTSYSVLRAASPSTVTALATESARGWRRDAAASVSRRDISTVPDAAPLFSFSRIITEPQQPSRRSDWDGAPSRDLSTVSFLRRRSHVGAASRSPVREPDGAVQGSTSFTSGLQLRYGRSIAPVSMSPTRGAVVTSRTTQPGARDRSPPRRSSVEWRHPEMVTTAASVAPKPHRGDVTDSAVWPSHMPIDELRRTDLFQGRTRV